MSGIENIQVVIPAQDEEAAVASVIKRLHGLGFNKIRVIDNGSRDRTAERAAIAGAEVVGEPKRGYGNACLRGCLDLGSGVDWILFCDADGSDDLEAIPSLLERADSCDFVLGNRRGLKENRKAMTFAQYHGNGLAVFLIRLGWGHRYHDLGPLRMIRRPALEKLRMRDGNYGWTVEMQIRALEEGLSVREVEMGYFPRREGRSKISGTIGGTLKAGGKILWTIFRLYLRRIKNS